MLTTDCLRFRNAVDAALLALFKRYVRTDDDAIDAGVIVLDHAVRCVVGLGASEDVVIERVRRAWADERVRQDRIAAVRTGEPTDDLTAARRRMWRS